MQDALKCPVLLENDANAAAYGEFIAGAGRGKSSMAYVTVSTGVGCGIIMDGKIVSGAHEGAGEIGHLHLVDDGEPCVCGRRGCLEAYASGTGIARIARRKAAEAGWPQERLAKLDARMVADLARAGNENCMEIYRQAGLYLGKAFAALQMLLDVETIIVGGSVSRQMDLMKPWIQESACQYSYWGADIDSWLKASELGNRAGLIGAGALIQGKIKDL